MLYENSTSAASSLKVPNEAPLHVGMGDIAASNHACATSFSCSRISVMTRAFQALTSIPGFRMVPVNFNMVRFAPFLALAFVLDPSVELTTVVVKASLPLHRNPSHHIHRAYTLGQKPGHRLAVRCSNHPSEFVL